jgi:choice-of-anchor C domain-containing protein
MKTTRRHVQVAAALVALVSAGSAHANLLTNGSFESGSAIPGFPPFISPTNGSTAVTGWTVVAGNIDYGTNGNGFWAASDGSRSIDMNGSEAGSIAQTFATVSGAQYQVLFDMAGNFYGGTALKSLRVSAGGTSQDFTFDSTGKSANAMGWLTKSFVFTATSTSTQLVFSSLVVTEPSRCTNANLGAGAACYGAALDNVRADLYAAPGVPEPATAGLLALGLLGTAVRRKRR